jgi:hypothetical protein
MLEIRRRIEGAGRDLIAIAQAIESGAGLGGEASSVIAAIALGGLGCDLAPPLIQAKPTRPGLLRAASESTLANMLPNATRPHVLVLSAGLLQILDDWDASHKAAQLADDLGEPEFAAYWHAIAHRREPDPGNASYWFRRVGAHCVFKPLAESVRPMLEADGNEPILGRLVAGGIWDPMAFIRYCGEAAKQPGSTQERLARRIQRVEMLLLLDATCKAL